MTGRTDTDRLRTIFSGIRLLAPSLRRTLLTAALGGACLVSPQGRSRSCTAQAETAIGVRVLDDETAAEICDAEVNASDGVHTARLERVRTDNCTYITVSLPAGEYEVLVRRVGYETIELHDVEVHDDGCQVIAANRDVRLRPSRS